MKYPNLHALIQQESDARDYFNSLPQYVQEQISMKASGVNSFDSLKDFAENLLRGDQ